MNDSNVQFYNATDIMEIIGCKQTKAYEVIRELHSQLKKEIPGAVPIEGKIPKWYFNEKVLGKVEKSNTNENN